MTARTLVGLGIALISATGTLAASPGAAAAAIQLVPVLTGLSAPILVTNARDGSNRLFVVEQGGIIRVFLPGNTPTVFLDITTKVLSGGERGLLGLAFHPQFSTNRRFFVAYTSKPAGAKVIAEYLVSPTNPDLADSTETVLLVIPQPAENHNGGMVEFGPDGFLYIATGDGGGGNDPNNHGQNINDLLGKILRIDVDTPNGPQPYSSPPSNPFFGATPGADEIYAYGLRNPWRFSFDRETGDLYVGDVGQGAWEEIDIVTLGGNYGWRVYEGNHCTGLEPALCNPAGFIFPIAEYSHAGGRCSVTGGYVYRGTQSSLPAGSYVYADYCTGEIWVLEGSTSTLTLDTAFNISAFGEDEAGELYVVNLGGTIHRIACDPATSCTTPVLNVTPSSVAFGSVSVNTTRDLTFTVQNTGIGTLTGTAVASAPFSVVGGSPFSVAAGASQVVTVRFSPTSAATFVSNVNINTNTNDASPSVTGTGTAVNLTLTITKAGSGNGTVTSSPAGISCGATCSAAFTAGTPVVLTATAGANSIFTGWSGTNVNCPGTGTCSVTLNANTTVTAAFNPPGSLTLTVSLGGSALGTVTSTPPGINCSALNGGGCSAAFAPGTGVTLSEAPANGATFKTWRTDCTGMSSSASVSMTANRLCRAIFSQTFTDATLIPRTTTAKAVHVTELRSAVSQLRAVNGLGGFSFTDGTISAMVTVIKRLHVSDLRTALCAAYTQAGLTCPTYATDPTIVSGQTTLKAQHVIDLRNNVRGLE